MKRPYIDQEQRLFLHWYRQGLKTMIGAGLELNLSWKRLQREVEKTIKKSLCLK